MEHVLQRMQPDGWLPATGCVPHTHLHHNHRTIVLLLLLLLFSFQGHTEAFCPSKCQCLGGDANSRAYCVDAALEDVPIQLNPETRYINLTLNKIRNIEYTLPFYMKLEVLDLSQNIIETLGSKNFEYQTELRTLNLSHNSVSSLQKDAFRGLSNLLLLDLSYNRIEIVHSSALHDLSALIEFDLTNNNIVSLEDGCFRNMMSLEIFVFKNNQLLDVPASNLQHLHALKSLDLSDNLVEYVRNDSFEGLKELVALTLRGNVISELDAGAFEGLITLKHMDLADNNLTMVPTQQLSKLSNLTHLTLSGNRFAHLPPVAFLNLFHLRELHLNRLDRLMRIDSRAFVDNTHLQSLHLSHNPQLGDIPMRLFQGNPNIVEVVMQANSLQTLYAAQFPIDQLEKLYLGDNPLQCNCTLFWLWRLVTGNYDAAQTQAAGQTKSGRNEPYPEDEDDDGAAVAALGSSTKQAAYLQLDAERIGCEVWHDSQRTRRRLAAMSEGEITCPAHIVTIVCAVLTGLLVLMTGASIVFYMRFVKRRRKLLHDRSLRGGKSVVNVHDRILQHQPLNGGSGGGRAMGNGIGMAGGMLSGGSGGLLSGGGGMGGGGSGGSYPHHGLQTQRSPNHPHGLHPLHHQDYHQTVPQVDKLELERYLTAQAIANEYRALKPWEVPPVKRETNPYSDEPEHLYEKFDHYDYPDTPTLAKPSPNGKLVMGTGSGSATPNGGGTLAKPHVVYV